MCGRARAETYAQGKNGRKEEWIERGPREEAAGSTQLLLEFIALAFIPTRACCFAQLLFFSLSYIFGGGASSAVVATATTASLTPAPFLSLTSGFGRCVCQGGIAIDELHTLCAAAAAAAAPDAARLIRK